MCLGYQLINAIVYGRGDTVPEMSNYGHIWQICDIETAGQGPRAELFAMFTST